MPFLNIPSIYWDDESLNNDQRVLLAIFHSYDGQCFWGIDRLCQKFRTSRPTMFKLIKDLESRGYIELSRRSGKSTTYRTIERTSKESLPVKNFNPTSKESLRVPVKNFNPTSKESLPYKEIYKERDKEKDKESTAPADAPAPSSPLKDLLTTESVIKESFTTEETESPSLEKPGSVIGEAPPISPTPPAEAPEPRRFVVAELSEADRSKLLAQIHGPATLAGKDPEKLLAEILGRAEAWSNTGTDKKKFRPSWYETLKRQFVGKEIKALSAQTAKAPASQTGLARDRIETLWDLGWKDHHPADWPEPAPEPKWVTDWHREIYHRACLEAFGLHYSKLFREEPAKNANFYAPKFRRAMETIKLPETNQ